MTYTDRKLIHVTADDIANGCKGDAGNCPIARAVLRELPGTYEAFVTYNISTSDREGGDFTRWQTSRAAHRFIHSFDNDRPVKPFNFNMVPFAEQW